VGMAKAVALLGVVSLLILLLAQWEGAGISSAWSNLTIAVSANPYANVPAWPTFQAPTPPASGTSCSSWDLICWTSAGASSVAYATSYVATAGIYIGQLIFTAFQYIFAFLQWFFGVASGFGGAMISFLTAPMSVFSGNNGYFGWLILVPILVMVFWEFIKLARGGN